MNMLEKFILDLGFAKYSEGRFTKGNDIEYMLIFIDNKSTEICLYKNGGEESVEIYSMQDIEFHHDMLFNKITKRSLKYLGFQKHTEQHLVLKNKNSIIGVYFDKLSISCLVNTRKAKGIINLQQIIKQWEFLTSDVLYEVPYIYEV